MNTLLFVITLGLSAFAQNQLPPLQADQDSYNQMPKFFGNDPIEENLAALFHLTSGQTKVSPWSGSYWATFRFGLAERYADDKYPVSRAYEDFAKYHDARINEKITTQRQVDLLSPAEKYDLLVGDSNKTLTRYSINNGKSAYHPTGTQTWHGLCHGWAPASYMVPRPIRTVAFKLKNGLLLRFYPDDVKGLATLLWASTLKTERFIGNRCNRKILSTPADLRTPQAECFDINPGTWHILVLNQIGIRQSPFIMDATYDLEVWNHPVRAYALKYFNPKTKKTASRIEDAIVLRSDFAQDPYADFRGRRTHAIVGVSMEVEYVTEVNAIVTDYDRPEDDFTKIARYNYDLELDVNGRITGGEWHQSLHPDFAWSPYETTSPVSFADGELKDEWTAMTPPEHWALAAQKASAKGQPLAKVLKKLVKLASTSAK
jgi:hypothetical protein